MITPESYCFADRCHAQLERQTQEITTLYQEVAEHQRNAAQEIAEISVELDAAPLRNEEKERLERLRDGLEQERQKLSDAAAQFGKEKASLEVSFCHLKSSFSLTLRNLEGGAPKVHGRERELGDGKGDNRTPSLSRKTRCVAYSNEEGEQAISAQRGFQITEEGPAKEARATG